MSQGWDKELMEVGRVAEGDRGGARKKVASGGIIKKTNTHYTILPRIMLV